MVIDKIRIAHIAAETVVIVVVAGFFFKKTSATDTRVTELEKRVTELSTYVSALHTQLQNVLTRLSPPAAPRTPPCTGGVCPLPDQRADPRVPLPDGHSVRGNEMTQSFMFVGEHINRPPCPAPEPHTGRIEPVEDSDGADTDDQDGGVTINMDYELRDELAELKKFID